MLRLQATRVVQACAYHQHFFSTLDARFVEQSPELVLSNLRQRRASQEQLDVVHKVGEFSQRRRRLVGESDLAKSVRKTLSNQIGGLMKAGKDEQVRELKEQVANATASAKAFDAELAEIEASICFAHRARLCCSALQSARVQEETSKLMMALPNLLDQVLCLLCFQVS